jgi:hypothetical protein
MPVGDGEGWVNGPYKGVRTDAWFDNAAYLVGRLSKADFDRPDAVHGDPRGAAEWGETAAGRKALRTPIRNLASAKPRDLGLGGA